jgi:unsaturated rhamnogalacturonyl hydrolase
MRRFLMIIGCFLSFQAIAQTDSWPVKMASTVMNLWKDSLGNGSETPVKWSYDQGVVLRGIEGVWHRTAGGDYFRYMEKSMDHFLDKDGNIRTYDPNSYNLDNILCGRILLSLYKVTLKEKYYKAAGLLYHQLKTQPRTIEGGFWHKKIYPDQMWLDGLYMAEPFYAEWAATFHHPEDFRDIANQFILMEKHARDPATGLLYHGWDESREQAWANKTTGCSPNFWSRAMGWYGMALVDALDYFPPNHPGKKALIAILDRYATAIQKVQDKETGLWWDVLNFPHRKGNYPEASGSCMFVYTLAKAARRGWIPASCLTSAKKGYEGILRHFIENSADGKVSLNGTVSVSGLGGHPYRDGSYDYYISEKTRLNDPKGIGAFLLAANEMNLLKMLPEGSGKTVLLDCYFNNEYRKNADGDSVRFHYTWDDQSNSGFSFLGNIFHQHGAALASLVNTPTAASLKAADIYIIVDPDTKAETASPHYVSPENADVIYNWVKSGGVLLLMGNDSANAEFTHFNQLAEKFGIRFNWDCKNHVIGNDYETGAIVIPQNDPVLPQTKKIYIKDLSSLQITPPAKAHISKDAVVIMATVRIGKGTVFAVGDPWIYNEYTDGRKLPAEYENFQAASDLAKWLLGQSKKTTH